ncbi:MarR family winged helix-turn-helix transcriptional regulator [Actinomadura rupiterrae]|uniref:MarR family winged helix-turn-helix transcriptional regulator n=1 Tax=Actinomadura rupiterrae TaxID=559627 RepID=UPI0020A3594D|nr:MarR family transcriptional regulator [Actinomadura rupiterrae]MCP2343196.1 DNA-binding MarR family transcriptional regulator [Actinomadura rupiterrae]
MTSDPPSPEPRLPEADVVREVLGFVPLVEAYFRRGPAEMPAELAEIFRKHRLTARHGAVLPQLAASGTLGVSELAARMGVTLSTVSELVGTLSRAGLVEREEDPANRRRTLVSLADAHRAAVEGFVAVRAAPILRVLDTLAPRDREGFVAGLMAWAHEVQNY